MTCVATTPRGGKHDLQEIESRASGAGPDIRVVTRWCRNCGAVVVDMDIDGKTKPGEVMPMRFPQVAIRAARSSEGGGNEHSR